MLAAFAVRLARVWETREKRFNLAAKSANLEMWEWDMERDEICVPTQAVLSWICLLLEGSHSNT